MHSAGQVTEAARTASLRSLLRHVRAARRGRASSLTADPAVPPPFAGYVALGLGDLCHDLHRRAQSLDPSDGDLLCRYYGLAGPPVPLAEAGAGLGLRTRQVHNRLNRAVRNLAAELPVPPPPGGEPARLEPPRWPGLDELRSRLADRHYAAQLRRALEAGAASPAPVESGPGPGGRPRLSLPTALAQLAADAFGDPQPAAADRPWRRWRLRALAWTTVVAACPSLAVRPAGAAPREPPGSAALPDEVQPLTIAPAATAQALAGAADPVGVAAMLDAAQQALQSVDGPSARCWLTLAEQAMSGVDAAEDGWRSLRASMLRLWVGAESHVGSLRTFDRLRELELLTGPGPDTCLAAFDVSFMLSAFGHIDEALATLHAQRSAIAGLPPDLKPFYSSWLRVRAAIMLQKRAAMRESGDDLEVARRIVARSIEEDQLQGFELHEMDRTAATIDISLGEQADAARRRRSDAAFDRATTVLRRPPPSVVSYDPVRGSIPGSYRTDVRWALASMTLALHTDDPTAFASAATVGLRHWNGLPNAPIVGLALRRLVGKGGERFQLDMPAMAPPAPFTGWDAVFRPSPRILSVVGGQSWVCPSTVTRREAPTPLVIE